MPETSDSTRVEWICSTVDADGGTRVQGTPTNLVSMGIAAKGLLWTQGTTLKVRFLGGEPALHERVLAAARQWLVPGVKLAIEGVGPGVAAQIRVGFEPADGSWSCIGKGALQVHPSQRTMNLGWASLAAKDEDFLGTVIHEFGHALGLLHEHNHPEARISWNRAAVYQDLGASPNYWDTATIDANVFQSFDASTVITTNFDAASVMIYPIPSRWTTDGRSFMPSGRLSAGDKATILRLYS